MNNNFVLVEYPSNINNVVKHTFQSMQRIKLVCFDASPNYLVFGTTSGGIYIFQRDPCEFLKLVPTVEGSADLISISSDERHLGLASSRGFTLILENFIDNTSGVQYQVFNEHEGANITYLKWHRNELYVGDNRGKVSVVALMPALFQTKSMFQIPSATLMTLDSSIVQIDAYQCYLLISTKTRTYLCNTEKENYIQVGKKLRDGCFGACFCNKSDEVGELIQSARGTFQSVKQTEIIASNDNSSNTRIFCARPGARLWQVGFNANVISTHQFKSALNEAPTKILVVGCEEESVLTTRTFNEDEKVPDNFNFQKVYQVCEKLVLTYDSNKIYIFGPQSSKLVFWVTFHCPIKAVALVNSNLYIWKSNLEITVLSVVELEQLVLATLYKKQYYLCADLCLEFSSKIMQLLDHSKQLYLLSALKNKIKSEDLLKRLGPILDKITEANDKIFARRQKGNIVLVENLYSNDEVHAPPVKITVVDDNTTILKQYKLNKTHRTIEIPEVTQLVKSLDGEAMFNTFKRFMDYVKSELNEDATDWCQDQYLKQISAQCVPVTGLTEESFAFLTEAAIKANEPINFSCSCGYPLPKCHKYPPNFYKTALDILRMKKNDEKILKAVPYLWKYRVNHEIYGLNMTALIQFSHLGLFKEHTVHLTYDNWHDILGYFVKINKGICLNCDRAIDVESLMTWTELAKVIVRSLGAKNAIRILEKYEKVIPNGALDPSFYHACIFTHSFSDDDNVKADEPFRFLEGIDGDGYEQEAIAKYFKRKYIASRSPCYTVSANNVGSCLICNLPLKNDILRDCETATGCGHGFHKFCFDKSDNVCNVCN